MIKKIIIFMFIMNCINFFADDILVKFEKFDHDGKYSEALDFLIKAHEKDTANLSYIWRIGLTTFELSNLYTDNKKKIEFFDIGIKYIQPFLSAINGSNRDRAEIIHWYTINYASKLKLQGILAGRESIEIIPKMFKSMDKCIELDASYAPAYYFKAKIRGDIPFFLGGDKILMENNYKKAFELAEDKEKIVFYAGAAESFIQRNWSLDYKNNYLKNNKIDKTNLLSFNLSDKEYAVYLLNEVIRLYKNLKDPAVRETVTLNKAKSILLTFK